MNDEQLIQKAEETPFQDWSLIDNLILQTTDSETKGKLRKIQIRKFREEEYDNDSL